MVTIPAFSGTKPTRTDFRSAELALVQSLGGVYGTTVHEPTLTEFDAAGIGFRNTQKAEPRGMMLLSPTHVPASLDNGSVLTKPSYDRADLALTYYPYRWIAPCAMRLRRATFVHYRATPIDVSEVGLLELTVNGGTAAQMAIPDPAGQATANVGELAANEAYEWDLDVLVSAGDVIDLLQLKASSSDYGVLSHAGPPQVMDLFTLHLWANALHEP